MPFPVTHNGTAYSVHARAIHVVFNDDGSLRSLSVVAARDSIGGEEQRVSQVSGARAAQVIQALGGATPAQVAAALRAVIEEGTLDTYDDSRQGAP